MSLWQPDGLRTKSLSGRFLLIALPLVGLSAMLLFAFFSFLSFKSLEEDLLKKIEQTVDINSRVLSTPFWYLDIDNIDSALRAMVRDSDIVAVVARGADGTEFSRHGLSADQVSGEEVMSRRVYFERNETRHDVGELEVYYTKQRVHDLRNERILFDGALLILLLLTVAGSLLIANQRSIKVPLNRLLQSIRMNKHGRMRKPVEWSSRDELGQLIREYNEMVALQSHAEEEAQRKQALLEATLHNIGQGICLFDEDLMLMVWNERYVELLELPSDIVKEGTPMSEILRYNAERGEYGEVNVQALIADRIAIAQRREPYAMERTRPNGRVVMVENNPMPDGGFVATYTDVTERKQAEARMRHMAVHDVLTGLPNRTLFMDRLRQAILSARRYNRGVTVMFIDLDRFKDVNDTFGHDVGDMLIQEMGRRLHRITRDSDTAARLGGDEFAVIQGEVENIEDTITLAQRIVNEMTMPFECRGHTLHTTASIGITLFPEDADNPEQLVKNADMAMYAAKAEGRNNYRFFVPEMHDKVRQRKTVEEDLRKALELNQLTLHYQPKIDTASGQVNSVEALVRWNHPEKGMVSPGDFIPIAEECGLVIPLGNWVLREACRQTRIWHDRDLNIQVAVNLSAAHFQDKELVSNILETLEGVHLDHGYLEVEITESTLMHNPERAVETLVELTGVGVQVAIDDFGTGYSSLNYLKKFPVSAVKIDRSFVRDLMVDPDDKAIVDAVIGLGHNLKMTVVAEGVEELDQYNYLRAQGCDAVQGFYFSKPLPAEQIEPWLIKHNAAPQDAIQVAN